MNPLYFSPDGLDMDPALARTSHLGIGAHQDDLEIMAFHGIAHCYQEDQAWFSGITCTDGTGSPRPTGTSSAPELAEQRAQEQIEAAKIGHYSCITQLGFPSAVVRDPTHTDLVRDLTELLQKTRPTVLYTHNPFDRHATHLAVLAATLTALQALDADDRPATVYGCEVWRSLDWVPSEHLVRLPLSQQGPDWETLLSVFHSQIQPGKAYHLAAPGRARANATFGDATQVDVHPAVWLAVDLAPLVDAPDLSIADYAQTIGWEFVNQLRAAWNQS